MERKIWFGLFLITGILLTMLSGPAFAEQLANNTNDPMLYGRQLASQWAGEIMGRTNFEYDQSGEMVAWENKKMGMQIIPKIKSPSQWNAISHSLETFPSDTAVMSLFQSHATRSQKSDFDGTAWFHNWGPEKLLSDKDFFSSDKNTPEQMADESGSPQLPNALWLFGFGIIGILSVRRTSDHSNVT